MFKLKKNDCENSNQYPSRFQVGQKIALSIGEMYTEKAYVRTVMFTEGKVRYSVYVETFRDGDEAQYTTLHNLDSCLLVKGFPVLKDFGFDNYS